ncbi:VOC family protein [Allobacillus halotolerans]|uniref:VOC family protein n=1 Tax=Allobacillus halotolerans TaxID=570278 RepID=A0ABS6GQX3_9BACI|nr:VOC family protein [Allobacillus halotolerans]MBU6080827.1 VOC family protein [Allobacillus halotolerans]
MSKFHLDRVNTVIIPVKDLNESIQFYEEVLQLRKGYVDESMAYFSFGSDGNETTILLHVIDQPEPVEKGIVIELSVDDVVSAITSIKEAGGLVAQEPIDRDWGVKEAVIVDPNGYKLWISQPI